MILYCLRHGETTHNAEGRIQGQSDRAVLSDLGRRQSDEAARALAGRPIEAIYSSPLRRALETALLIARPHGLEVRSDPRLMEINAGIFQDKLRSEVNRLYPQEIAHWNGDDSDYIIPGGESRRQLARRGCEAFEAIRRARHREAVVVAHGRMLTFTFKSLVGIPDDQPPYSLHNGSISTLVLHDDGRTELVSLDRVDHLGSVGTTGHGDL